MKIMFERILGDAEPENVTKMEAELIPERHPELVKHLTEVFELKKKGSEIKNIAQGILDLAEIGLEYLYGKDEKTE